MEFATTSSRDQPGRTGKRTILDKNYRMPLNLRSVDSSEFKWELCLIYVSNNKLHHIMTIMNTCSEDELAGLVISSQSFRIGCNRVIEY